MLIAITGKSYRLENAALLKTKTASATAQPENDL